MSFWSKPGKHPESPDSSKGRGSFSSPERAHSNVSFASEGDIELGEDGEVQQQGSNPHKKIKFKRAKKLSKSAKKGYNKHLKSSTQHGRFHGWSKAELVQVMISNGIELRNEAQIDAHSLKELCVALYFDRDMPEKPAIPSIFDMVYRNVCARRIQNLWIYYQMESRHRRDNEASAEYIRRMNMLEEGGGDVDAIGSAELMYMGSAHQELVGDQRAQDMDAEEREADTDLHLEQCMEEGNAKAEGKVEDVASPRGRRKKRPVNVLDLPWEAPSLEKADIYANYVQPRKGGKGGSKFNFMHTTTGRHCCLGSMGEQFDLWEEGQISEFGIYGSGVTNYFKFIKWCFWLFAVLAVVSLPALVLNIEGPSNANHGLQALARTTVGNLAQVFANDTVSVHIPGCNDYGIYAIDCSLDKAGLAKFYSYLDIAIIAIAFFAFLWLRKFEKIEEIALDKNTVNASMFTVMVSRLPKDTDEDELITHFNKVCKGHKIASVALAFDNIAEIRECINRGDLIRAKVRAVHEHRYECTKIKTKHGEEGSAEKIANLRTSFFKKMAKLTEQLKAKEALLEEYAKTPANAIYAFVTFDKVAGKLSALDQYNGHSFLYNLFYGAHLNLRGRRLKVIKAAEPSTILWENLAVSSFNRFQRRFLTTFLAMLMIVISLVMIFAAEYLQRVRDDADDDLLCPDWTGFSKQQKQDAVAANNKYLSCYCDELNSLEQAQDSTCDSYLRDRIEAQVLQYFASFIVLGVNVAIEKVMRVFASYEKHHTEDGRGTGVFLRVFILKYINTSLVFFINNNPIILRDVLGVNAATTTEFTAAWFETIGVTIILVQLGDIFFSHGDKFAKWMVHRHQSNRARNNDVALTQDELNRSAVGPEFEFAFNYAQLLSTFFVCFTFSTGIPLLYLIGAGNFFVAYFVEKYLFIHLYRIPPHFSNNVGKRATALIPYALVLHLAISMWVLSNPELFEDNQDSNSKSVGGVVNNSVQDKITGQATFPLFIFLLLILVIRVLTHFFKVSLRSLKKFAAAFFGRCCTTGNDTTKKMASAQAVVTYSRAVQRNLIKGLSTYNILQNPAYKEAFAITWKFAVTNKHVRSVRLLKAKAHANDDETDAAKIDQLTRNVRTDQSKKKKINKNRSFAGSFYVPPAEDDAGNQESKHSNIGSNVDQRPARGTDINKSKSPKAGSRSQQNATPATPTPPAVVAVDTPVAVPAPAPVSSNRRQSRQMVPVRPNDAALGADDSGASGYEGHHHRSSRRSQPRPPTDHELPPPPGDRPAPVVPTIYATPVPVAHEGHHRRHHRPRSGEYSTGSGGEYSGPENSGGRRRHRSRERSPGGTSASGGQQYREHRRSSSGERRRRSRDPNRHSSGGGRPHAPRIDDDGFENADHLLY